MAITHKYTLLCDEVRQENNGKFLILGMYTPDIVVAQLPAALSSLTFFSVLDTDTPGRVQFNFRLTHGENLIAGGSGGMDVHRVGPGIVPIRMGPLLFQAAGDYVFTLDIEGAGPITHEFKVTLQVQNLSPAPAPTGRPH